MGKKGNSVVPKRSARRITENSKKRIKTTDTCCILGILEKGNGKNNRGRKMGEIGVRV